MDILFCSPLSRSTKAPHSERCRWKVQRVARSAKRPSQPRTVAIFRKASTSTPLSVRRSNHDCDGDSSSVEDEINRSTKRERVERD
ncbi:hypothetical protein L484_013094 [Morus notabilis]|uniref:Uncharacterized protein n=1 Tax=Morus notabilis TaxID=981085 RepID=W9RQ67_9ROSA|nr:hypothetical protein L484_013094 [Morus notabilis]